MAKQTNIRRRGKSWVVYFRANGRQVWKSFQTKDEAELYLARWMPRKAREKTENRRTAVDERRRGPSILMRS